MIHQKHPSVLPGDQRFSSPILHLLISHVLSCCACICTNFFLCYLLIHLPGKSVGIVRMDVLTFKAHGPYLSPYVMCLSPHENMILRKTWWWNTVYVCQGLNSSHPSFPASLIIHLQCYWL